MTGYLLLAIAATLLANTLLYLYLRHTPHLRRRAAIPVVDQRTMRLAQQRIADAVSRGRFTRANVGLTQLIGWLRWQVRTGPARTRLDYMVLLEQAERQKDQIAALAGPRRHKA